MKEREYGEANKTKDFSSALYTSPFAEDQDGVGLSSIRKKSKLLSFPKW